MGKRNDKKKAECWFCQQGASPDYKNPDELGKFISERGRIVAKARTGVCAKHQRRLSKAIKRARHLALLPFVVKPE